MKRWSVSNEQATTPPHPAGIKGSGGWRYGMAGQDDQMAGGEAMNGKGDARRPMNIKRDQFSSNWDRIFGKKPKVDPDWLDMDDDGEPAPDGVIQTPPDRRKS